MRAIFAPLAIILGLMVVPAAAEPGKCMTIEEVGKQLDDLKQKNPDVRINATDDADMVKAMVGFYESMGKNSLKGRKVIGLIFIERDDTMGIMFVEDEQVCVVIGGKGKALTAQFEKYIMSLKGEDDSI